MLIVAWSFVAASTCSPQAPSFHPPVRVTVDGKPLRVEECGHAAPAWGDLDADGKPDLVVGQFAGASMRVHRHVGGAAFAPGDFVQAAGEIAAVPDIA
jgi:hypothetical protein